MKWLIGFWLFCLLGLSWSMAQESKPQRTHGGVRVTAGTAPERGLPRPARLRAELFIPGLVGEERALLEPVLPTFRMQQPAQAPETSQLVFLAKRRPVRIALQFSVGTQPLTQLWQQHLKKLFAYFDRDRNGHLNRFEIEHIFSARGMMDLLAGSYYYGSPLDVVNWDDLDRDRDGRVSYDEFAVYYTQSAQDILHLRHVSVASRQPNDERFTNSIFELLDQNQDGKLSQQEVQRAENILFIRDANEDELLTTNELLDVTARQNTVPAEPKPEPDQTTILLHVFRTKAPKILVDQLFQQYDTSGDGQLSAKELGLPPSNIREHDRNADRQLDREEISNWLGGAADVQVNFRLGEDNASCQVEVCAGPPGGELRLPDGMECRQTQPNRTVLRVGGQFLDLMCRAKTQQTMAARRAQMQEFQFPAGKTVVTDVDIAGPQFQFHRIVFDSADHDGNGKLTRAEFDQYMQMQQQTIDLAIMLSYTVKTPSLFELLDENSDGRLSIRELRSAWDRLIVLQPEGSGEITRAALQPSASALLGYRSQLEVDPFRPSGAVSPGHGLKPPLWFQKMDRNRDGDLSRGEFLGSADDFRKLDLDQDGLISIDEALKGTAKK